MKSREMIVSVRIPADDLRKLQLIAQVTDQSVGAVIRTAVSKHIKEVANTDEFEKKATEMQRRYDEILQELVKPSHRRTPTRSRNKAK